MKTFILSLCCFLSLLGVNAQLPTLDWAKKLGNNTTYLDSKVIKTDAAGNFYSMGIFSGGTIDFDLGVNVFAMTSPPNNNTLYITKSNSNSDLIWAKQIDGIPVSASMAIDVTGNVYLAGAFDGTVDFDPNVGVHNLVGDSLDLFILKLDANGNFVWVKSLTSPAANFGIYPNPNIAADKQGNVYIVGGFFDQVIDFDPGNAQYNLTALGYTTFMLKLDILGNFVWANSIDNAGVGNVNANITGDFVLDNLDNLCLVGSFFNSVDFNPSSAVYNVTSAGEGDIFIAKYRASGDFLWVKTVGGDSSEMAFHLAIDTENNIVVQGEFRGTNTDFDPGVGVYNMSSTTNIGWDVAILKLDSNGDFKWAKSIESQFFPVIAIDNLNHIYITSYFSGTVDFDLGTGVFPLTSMASDLFVLKLTDTGDFEWVAQGKATNQTYPTSVAVDTDNNIYICGQFSGTNDFDPSTSTYNLSASYTNAFVLKWSQNSVGITDAFPDFNMKTYPNPTKDIFNLSISQPTNDLSLSIYNSLGELIYQKLQLTEENEIDLGNKASGLYMMRVSKGAKIIANEKIIKR